MPSDPPTTFPVEVQLVWPVRPNIAECIGKIAHLGSVVDFSVRLPSLYALADGIVLQGLSYSEVTFYWDQHFQGSNEEFREWARKPDGTTKLLRRAEQLQHQLIDYVKVNGATNSDYLLIRHFGPIDWVFNRIKAGGEEVHFRINDSVASQFRSQKSVLVPSGITVEGVDFTLRSLRRADDLASSGYPTEAALICIAVLDARIQKSLSDKMVNRGLSDSAAEALLRNTTTKRLATYLDPVLKLVSGQSLKDSQGDLFSRVGNINYLRNQAIHNGQELTRDEAREFLDVTRQVITYLEQV